MTTSILILNDLPVIREGLTAILDRAEDVNVVSSGPSSFNVRELVQRLQPDILMLDLQILGSIFQIANDAKESKPGLKIILTSSLPLPEHRRQAERVGAKGLVSSFDDVQTLVDSIKEVQGGNVFFPANQDSRTMVTKQREGVNNRMEHPLSPREVDVLCCVAQAMTAKEIARDLHISVKTVDRHKANIMNKLSMRSQIELARYAIRNGFVEA
ncbi:LuxR C-terminal-related transcriptional regulator [Pseudobacteriovorax antillogorgiicola]|nr:response regulator transcription factor [Pseudobacteriovorax antillogorgiicola]